MEMTEVMVSADHALIRQYLVKVSAGLKQIGELQKKEILAEIDSHLRERIEELRAGVNRIRLNKRFLVWAIPLPWHRNS